MRSGVIGGGHLNTLDPDDALLEEARFEKNAVSGVIAAAKPKPLLPPLCNLFGELPVLRLTFPAFAGISGEPFSGEPFGGGDASSAEFTSTSGASAGAFTRSPPPCRLSRSSVSRLFRARRCSAFAIKSSCKPKSLAMIAYCDALSVMYAINFDEKRATCFTARPARVPIRAARVARAAEPCTSTAVRVGEPLSTSQLSTTGTEGTSISVAIKSRKKRTENAYVLVRRCWTTRSVAKKMKTTSTMIDR